LFYALSLRERAGMRVFLTFIVIVADAAIHGCVFRWLLVGFRVGVFVACELGFSPLPIGYRLRVTFLSTATEK
jgi:hypothetical protein